MINKEKRRARQRKYYAQRTSEKKKEVKEYMTEWRLKNKEKSKIYSRQTYRKNPKKAMAASRAWRLRPENRERVRVSVKKSMVKFIEKHPLFGRYWEIRKRCGSPSHKDFKNYGAKGVKCLITLSDLEMIFERDNAFLMFEPVIYRQGDVGNYSIENCCFIEKDLSNRLTKHKKSIDTNCPKV